MTPLWRASDPNALYWRSWDDEYVVYNDASGDTHCFGPDTAALLRTLSAGPATRDALRDRLRTAYPGAAGDEADERLDAILAALIDVGLVEAE